MREEASSRPKHRWFEDQGWWIGLLLLLLIPPVLPDGEPVDLLAKGLIGALTVWSLVARTVRGFLLGWREPAESPTRAGRSAR
jgi:hypothetical protein